MVEVVLKTARRYRKKVLVASTSEVYGKNEKVPFNEDDDRTLGPTTKSRWSYAASKELDEFLALAYHKAADLPVVVFRLFNTVGARQRGQDRDGRRRVVRDDDVRLGRRGRRPLAGANHRDGRAVNLHQGGHALRSQRRGELSIPFL
jgi:nucleoside-diphosphate-sugar epimerase